MIIGASWEHLVPGRAGRLEARREHRTTRGAIVALVEQVVELVDETPAVIHGLSTAEAARSKPGRSDRSAISLYEANAPRPPQTDLPPQSERGATQWASTMRWSHAHQQTSPISGDVRTARLSLIAGSEGHRQRRVRDEPSPGGVG